MKKIQDMIPDIFAHLVLIIGGIIPVSVIGLLVLFGLHSCVAEKPSQELAIPETTQEAYYEAATHAYESEERREIVAYTPDGWPVYEDDILPPPEEYIFDDYGVMYRLVDGTYDQYEMVEDYQEEIETPESTTFTRILYWPYFEELSVEFRSSGAWYIYYDVPVEVWYSFKTADSKGSFFNSEIKGQYEYERDY